MRAWVLAAVLVAGDRSGGEAEAARAPVIVSTTCDAVATLGLGDGTTTLELSQSDVDRDAALRGSDGLLSWRVSTVIHAMDRATSIPHGGSQLCIASPAFGAIDEVAGWRVVYARLAALPDARHRELAVGGVVATLDRWDVFDIRDRAWVIGTAFDEAPPTRGGWS